MLLGLSVELLEEIGHQLVQSDQASLRAACKDLNGAINRLFFSVLVLNPHPQRQSENGVQMLQALANGDIGWSLHARTLWRRSGDHTESQKPKNDGRRTHMTLEVGKFIIKSPGSVSHNLSMNSANELPIYHQVAALVSQNPLHCLHLEGPSEWSTVWRILRTSAHVSGSQVTLAEITPSVVTPDLFTYLASYSGLEKLTLKSPDGGSREQTDRLADSFFDATLPRHAASLTALSFGTHNVDGLSLFRKLRTLEMSVNAGAVRLVENPTSQWVDADGNCYFVDGVSMAGISVEVEQADIDPVVTLLLETAATLPALRSLTIVGPDTERNRGNSCGDGMLYHKGVVDVAIERAVMAFRSKMPSSAVVRASYRLYGLQPLRGSQEESGSDGESWMLGYRRL
ncbi:hypothetical protein DFH08DRAFT_988577 [Mycena albidolilacea]|uniref:F-box domain-containing protein n=1 Tax=Mycena albidolilacea TaxID=1033008 RepID=A0AAD6Z0Y5_9AGAR|nr:hypothetical protein DFH08DRAFT_988577 [Mycena albidolilacea]